MSCLMAQWLGTQGTNMVVNFVAERRMETHIQWSGHGHSHASA